MNASSELPGPVRKFNPGTLQSDEEVTRQFVVRQPKLDIVLEVLRGNVDSPSCQHVLIVAPRGRGKTMLLARIAAELRAGGALSERLLPVRFMEESQEIFTLADFWLEALFHLARECRQCDSELARELQEAHAELAAGWRGEDLAERVRATVLEVSDRLGRKLVLMVENLQALCESVDDDFGWKLRGVLQSEPQIILLATATSRFKGLDDAREPFFELFRILRLEPLDTEECGRLWRAVSGDKVSEREIRPLEILTGGNPRLLVIVAGFARHRSLRQLMEELVTLIDDHTEYFRSHLEGFAKTERRVYLAVIDLWQSSSTGEIAARARMDVRPVSTLLGRLVERGAVVVEGSGRKRRYAAAERLYSIYYKLRRERDEAAVVRNLIQFMAVFYTESELKDWSRAVTLEAAQWPAIRDGLMLAVSESPQIGRIFSDEKLPEFEQISIQPAAFNYKQAEGALDEITAALGERAFERVIEIAEQFLSSPRANLLQVPDWLIASIVSGKAFAYEGLDEPEMELAVYDEVIGRFGCSEAPGLPGLVAMVILRKGITQEQIGEDRAAVATFDELVERFGNSDAPELQEWIAKALVGKGHSLQRLHDGGAAIATYDKVIERFGDNEALQIEVQVARALANKGITQEQLGENSSAVTTFDELVERFGNSDAPELQEWIAKALVTKGHVLEQMDEGEAAITTYGEAVKRFGDSDSPEIGVQIARAWVRMGFRQGLLGEHKAAIDTFDQAVARFGRSDVPELEMQVAIALVNKGVWLGLLGEIKAAIVTFDEVVERFERSEAPELQEGVARALATKGFALEQLGENDTAIAIYDQVFERFGDSDVPEVQVQVAVALANKGGRQLQLGEIKAAIVTFDEVVERFERSEAPELQEGVARALATKGFALEQLGENDTAIAIYDQVFERFGDSDVPEVQAQVAIALVNKGGRQLQLGEITDALASFDEMIERFGDSDDQGLCKQVATALNRRGFAKLHLGQFQLAVDDWEETAKRFGDADVPELQVKVVEALINKTDTQIQAGRIEESLRACEELDRRITAATHKDKSILGWRVKWLRAKALLVEQQHPDAMEVLETVYAAFDPSAETMILETLVRLPDLIANGASESELARIFSGDREKADALLPLVVALRQRAGESVRAPAEALEVAKDIHKMIEARVSSIEAVSPGTPIS